MAKIFGLNGTLSGRQGNTVFAVRNGVNIARKYQPIVADPKSEAQVASRAKLKMLSQMSAVYAPILAIPRQGSMSSRNIFTKLNYPSATFADGEASIVLSQVKLTNGVLSLPNIIVTRSGDDMTVSLESSLLLDVDRVVYAVFVKNADDTLFYTGSATVTEAGTGNAYSHTFNFIGATINAVVYAYGVRDNTESARVKFGNLVAPTAEQVAKIITTRQLLESDITLTETKGAESNPE